MNRQPAALPRHGKILATSYVRARQRPAAEAEKRGLRGPCLRFFRSPNPECCEVDSRLTHFFLQRFPKRIRQRKHKNIDLPRLHPSAPRLIFACFLSPGHTGGARESSLLHLNRRRATSSPRSNKSRQRRKAPASRHALPGYAPHEYFLGR